jgi:DNA-damage-inducible protein J
MKTKILQVRIEEEVKNEAEAIFKNIGLDLSTGVRLYLNRVVKERGIPFPMKEGEVKNESKND